MAKQQQKTNAMRILEQKKLPHTVNYYECGEFTDAVQIAEMLGQDPERTFKTLMCVGKSGAYYVFVVPVREELDLKKASKACGEKAVAMIKQKELLPLTGYVHGGCSPIGMKKSFKTTIHKSAEQLDKIFFSAGKIGYQIETTLDGLKRVVRLNTADIIKDGREK
jgi:Cys-tRNA(Pro)/Cys-tRNA(Cys) deacylase